MTVTIDKNKFSMTRQEICHLFDINERRFYFLITNSNSDEIRDAHNYFNLKLFYDKCIKTPEKADGEVTLKEELLKEKIRVEKAKAENAEIRLKEQKGELKKINQIKDELKELVTNLKRKMLTWRRSLSPLLAHKSEAEVDRILEPEINKALSEFAKGLGKF